MDMVSYSQLVRTSRQAQQPGCGMPLRFPPIHHSFEPLFSFPILPTATTRWATFTHLPRLKHLIAKQEIAGNTRRARDSIPEDSETIVDTALHGIRGFAEREIETGDIAVCVFVLEGGDYFMLVRQEGERQEVELAGQV